MSDPPGRLAKEQLPQAAQPDYETQSSCPSCSPRSAGTASKSGPAGCSDPPGRCGVTGSALTSTTSQSTHSPSHSVSQEKLTRKSRDFGETILLFKKIDGTFDIQKGILKNSDPEYVSLSEASH